jgi:hypothetical protein
MRSPSCTTKITRNVERNKKQKAKSKITGSNELTVEKKNNI